MGGREGQQQVLSDCVLHCGVQFDGFDDGILMDLRQIGWVWSAKGSVAIDAAGSSLRDECQDAAK